MKKGSCFVLVMLLLVSVVVPAFSAVYRPDLSDEITEFHYWAKNRYPEFLYKAYYFFYWSNGNPALIQIASNSKVISNGSIVQAYLYNSRGGAGQSLFNSRVTLSLSNDNPILTIVESGAYGKTFVLDAGYFVEDLSTAYLSNTYSVSSNHDWIIDVLAPPDESEPDKPPPIVIGGYDVPKSMLNAVSTGDITDIVTDFVRPFLDHAMSAFSFVIPLLGLFLATKLIPKIFRFFVR